MERISCSAVLFDLDGVLVESIGSVERQWTRWAKEYGLDPAQVVAVAHGRPTIDTIREFVPQIPQTIDVEAELWKMEEREIGDMDCVHPVAGAADLLARIPPDRWTVVTSGTRPLATARLNYVGLPVPPTMITASEITRGKPDPEPYLKGAAALKMPPKECVVIEDAPSGIRAGQTAGMRVIAVPSTYSREAVAEADYVINRLSDLRLTVTNTSGRQNVRIEIIMP
jgi:sugar-phosphatase